MSRRHRAVRRPVQPDPKYNSELLSRFIQKVMMEGKKHLARKIVYDALTDLCKKLSKENPLEIFEAALENAAPQVEVKSRRIGGATYQVPIEIAPGRRESIAMGWIIKHARSKPGKNMVQGLSQELQDCYNNQGSTVKKKEDTHRMAEANKAFSHF